MNDVQDMLVLILFPIYFAFATTSDLVFPKIAPVSASEAFVYRRAKLEATEPAQIQYYSRPLRQIADIERFHGQSYSEILAAADQFPNVMSCVEATPRSQHIDLTKWRTPDFRTRRDVEVCAWQISNVLGSPMEIGAWLEAVGFRDVSEFEVHRAHGENTIVVGVWRNRRLDRLAPIAWPERWNYVLAYRVELRITYRAEIGVIDVQMVALFL